LRDDEYVDVSGDVVAVTERAVLIRIDEIDGDDSEAGEEHWFPLSVCNNDADCLERGEQDVEFCIATWFARKQGWL
jgi:hypothetical protein